MFIIPHYKYEFDNFGHWHYHPRGKRGWGKYVYMEKRTPLTKFICFGKLTWSAGDKRKGRESRCHSTKS